jgi:hypothetical protein
MTYDTYLQWTLGKDGSGKSGKGMGMGMGVGSNKSDGTDLGEVLDGKCLLMPISYSFTVF